MSQSDDNAETTAAKGSRIPGFYRLSVAERRDILRLRSDLSEADLATWDGGGIDTSTADQVVENVVGVYALPLGVGLNFRVNGQDYLIPMAVEEPSVIAAASNAARMVRQGGGFQADADEPIMTAQIEIVGVTDPEASRARIEAAGDELLGLAHAALPRLSARGGGARELEVRALPGRVIAHVHIDCRDAMGANMVNTVAESLAERVAELAGGRGGLRILTNLCDRRRVRVSARVPAAALATAGMDGGAVRDGIVAASRFAEDDPYRAATHNKGIMNGVDAVVIATGNDWRSVEAGAHAFAAASGRYMPLATWRQDEGPSGDLVGQLEMPMAVGTVGGTLQAHAGARLAQRLLGVTSATTLGMIVGAAGLASNLAALRALATEGIQRGHMALHQRSVGVARRAKTQGPSAQVANGTPAVPAVLKRNADMIRQVLRDGRDVGGPGETAGSGKKPIASVPRPPMPWLDPPAGPWTVQRAYEFCEEFARAHTESFPVASRFVPAEVRPHLVALYAFARSADDFADEPQYEGRRIEALDRWEDELARASHGEATHPVFVALADTIERRDLPIPPLEDMLSAFRADIDVRRYSTFSALRGYTARSADPVGRLLLPLFGYRQPELVRYADEISTALQLTNFWQDVAADAARDHIYLPAEDLHFFGVTEAEVKALKPTRNLRDLMRYQVARTRALYERGRPLLHLLGSDLRMELTLIWLIGTTILDKIEDADFDVFTQRPQIRRRDKALIMARAAKGWASHMDLAALKALWPQ